MLPHWIDGLPVEDRAVLDDLVGGLAERFAALAECGIPDTLMHGDFHPGNVRSDGTHRVLIDWGDSRIGHPAVDLIRMRDWHGSDQEALCEQWCAYWRRAVPGSEPERAVELIDPVVRVARCADLRHVSCGRSNRPSGRTTISTCRSGLRAAIRTAPYVTSRHSGPQIRAIHQGVRRAA